ncbi:hypothetical protein ACIBH1_44825 [Nonomuraea sp. NPDC050663]|uniref:hypothetical protein n=1 Tax=Nonomuraea sp. NPDC050663 TaxID=3364370 RepID=UPI003795FFD8
MNEQQATLDEDLVPYPEEHRQANLAKLRELMGEPSPEMLELVRARDEEFAARRNSAA